MTKPSDDLHPVDPDWPLWGAVLCSHDEYLIDRGDYLELRCRGCPARCVARKSRGVRPVLTRWVSKEALLYWQATQATDATPPA